MRQRQGESHVAPKLPKALLDQLGGASSDRHKNAPTRKERRKQERQQKKGQQSRSRPQQKRRPKPVIFNTARQPDDDDDSLDSGDEPAQPVQKPPRQEKAVKSILKKTKKQDPPPSKTRDDSPPPPPRVSRAVKERLAQDDAEIAALEKRLGIKGTGKSKALAEDGLDELLEGLDDESDGDGRKRKRSDDDEWLRQKRRKVGQAAAKEELSDDEEDEEDGEDNMEDGLDDLLDGLGEDFGSEDEDAEDGLDLEDDEDMDDHDEEASDDDEDDEGLDTKDNDFAGFDDDDEDDSEYDEAPEPPRQRENPYVAPVAAGTASAATAPAQKYVPPSLRGAPSSDTEALQRLRRQIQGQLNRLSEANLLSILQSVEQIYQNNPRQYVTTTLIDLLLGLICDRTSLMDTFLILHAGFIAALYKVIGTDFGAQVIERIVTDFDKHYVGGDMSGKETSNLMSLLSELYNFQIIGGNLVFDYIRVFLEELNEANTELLLKIIRNSGPQLRSDDPSALKDIVVLLQKQVSKIGEANLSVRTKFMIETINNLKNNRVKTGVAASVVVSEHTIRMKKTLGSLNNRSSLKGSEPLRIGLSDIRDTEKKGKWWLVGASYHDPAKLVSNQDGSEKSKTKSSAVEATSVSADEGTSDLLQLARQQGMNTDIRRAIFVTIMSASDCQDAHLRLLKLNFKKAQELEIPRVLIHCTGAEATYNPYYTLIAKKLCSEKRMRMAFQFGLWDLFKRMGERGAADEDDAMSDDEESSADMNTRKIVNLARLFADLILEAGLPITVLKTLNFAYLQPKTTTFAEVLLTKILVRAMKKSKSSKWELSVGEVFSKAQDVPEMVQGLRYFVEKVVSGAEIANGKSEREAVRKGCKMAIEALTMPVEGQDLLEDSD